MQKTEINATVPLLGFAQQVEPTYWIEEQSLTWFDAKITCEQNNSHLAVVIDYETHEIIRQMVDGKYLDVNRTITL